MLFCSILAVLASAPPAREADYADSLQAKVDAAPAGDTVKAEACIYREQVSITKPLTLVGQPGSEIRGSEVWTSWTAWGDKFVSSKTLPDFYQEDVSCQEGTQRCAWPEQVFMDGKPSMQVAPDANLASGQFKVNASRTVVLGSSSTGKTVEVTVRKHWITVTTSADGVTIRGLTMRHAANDWRCGASDDPSLASFKRCGLAFLADQADQAMAPRKQAAAPSSSRGRGEHSSRRATFQRTLGRRRGVSPAAASHGGWPGPAPPLGGGSSRSQPQGFCCPAFRLPSS